MDSDSANGQSGPGRDDPLEAAMAVAGPPAHGREYAAAAVQAAGIQEAPNPLNVEHALSVLKDQLSTLVELQYFDPKKKNEPSKRLSNLLRPYRAALLELEDFVRASHDEDRAAQRTISSYLHLELTDGLVALNAVQAMQDVSVALGFEPSHIELVQSGSLNITFKSLWARISNSRRLRSTAKELAAEGRRYIETRALEAQQAKVDATNAESIRKLIDAIGAEENALAKVGAIIIYRTNSVLRIRALNAREMNVLDRYPGILADVRNFETQLALLIATETTGNAD